MPPFIQISDKYDDFRSVKGYIMGMGNIRRTNA